MDIVIPQPELWQPSAESSFAQIPVTEKNWPSHPPVSRTPAGKQEVFSWEIPHCVPFCIEQDTLRLKTICPDLFQPQGTLACRGSYQTVATLDWESGGLSRIASSATWASHITSGISLTLWLSCLLKEWALELWDCLSLCLSSALHNALLIVIRWTYCKINDKK